MSDVPDQSVNTDPPMDEVRILSDSEAIRELSDPLRRRELEELTSGAQSGSQLARKLDIRASKVHYAIRELERHGLIRLVGTRPIRGTTEKFFRAVARNFISDLRLGAVADWDMTQLARYLGQPFLQQYRSDVLRIDTRTLARRIVRDQLNVRPGEIVAINASSEVVELVEALVLEIQLAGAEEELRFISKSIAAALYDELPLEYLEYPARRREFMAEEVDAAIYLADTTLWSVDPPHDPQRVRRIQERAWKMMQRYAERRVRQLVVTPLLYGNLDWNSREDLEIHDAYWRAVLVSGDELRQRAEELQRIFREAPEVTVETGDGLELRFRVDADHATISDGLCRTGETGLANLPAGELVLLVETDSAHGRIHFDFTPREGTKILGVEMTIDAGRIVEAKAAEGQAVLDELLRAVPQDGDLISIFCLGLNPEIPAELRLATTDLVSTPIVDKACGIASVAFGTNRPFGGNRDVPFFWSYSALSPRVKAGDVPILVENRFQTGSVTA